MIRLLMQLSSNLAVVADPNGGGTAEPDGVAKMTKPPETPPPDEPNVEQAAVLYFRIMQRELAANMTMILANHDLTPT